MDNIQLERKERDSFFDGLRRFHSGKGTPIRQIPSFGGHEVDLFQLYRLVTVRGGWGKVNEEQKWDEIAEEFHIPVGCANASQALRYIYIRYLDLYEKVHYFGEDPDQKRSEGQEELPGQRKKISYASSVPMYYNISQHRISDYMRQMLHLPKPLGKNFYEKLELALMSGLPNEVDFTMNICTLLSSEGKHTLHLQRAENVVNLLLGHIGIFETGPGSLKEVHLDSWKPASGYNFLRFWWESIEDANIKKLICPEVAIEPETEDDSHPPSSRVLNLKRDIGMYDKEGQRVIQVAMAMRNLSFEVENMKVLASNETFLRFIVLAVHCNYHCVRQLALDTLGNIGLQMILSPLESQLKHTIFTILRQCLTSEDKFEIVSGLELLARLCQVPSNKEILSDSLDSEIYTRVVSYLTVHDIQLIAHTLECLYQLSELGEVSATHIAKVASAVSTLVSLVTVEAQSYGPESIKGIRVVEHVPAGMPSTMAAPSQVAPRVPFRQPVPQPAQPVRRPLPTATPPSQARVASVATPPPKSSTPPVPESDKAMICRWLTSFYEICPNSQVNKMEMYANYLQALSKIGQSRVPDMREMIICVRMAFPRVDILKLERDNSSNPIIILKGIRPRNIPQPFEALSSTNTGGFAQPAPVNSPHQAVSSRPSTPQNPARILPRGSSTPVQNSQLASPHSANTNASIPSRPQFQAPRPAAVPLSSYGTSQPTPPQSPPNKQSMLQQALLRNSETVNGSVDPTHTPLSPSPTPPLPVQASKPSDQTLIKTLLANKLQQSVQRYADMQDNQFVMKNVVQKNNVSADTNQVNAQSDQIQNGSHALNAGSNSNVTDMPPPLSVPNVTAQPENTSQIATQNTNPGFVGEFETFMNNSPANKKARRRSSTSPSKGKVKKSKSTDQNDCAIEESEVNNVDRIISEVVASSKADTAGNELNVVSDCDVKDMGGISNVQSPVIENNVKSSGDVQAPVQNTQTVNTTQGNCDAPCDNRTESDMDITVNSSTSPKEISPNKFNTSIEEKKARIAKLMKDTKLWKEQIKAINGVSPPSVDTVKKDTASESNVKESQGQDHESLNNENHVKGAILSSPNCIVNGFPEGVNGNHLPESAIENSSKNSDFSTNKDLNQEEDSKVVSSSSTEVLNTSQGLTLDDLNRNNNCNGEGDSPPPSPRSTTSSLPSEAPATSSATNPSPASVQLNLQGAMPMPIQQSVSNTSDANPGAQQTPTAPNSLATTNPQAQFVQPSQIPGPIMSVIPQSSQSAVQPISSNPTQSANSSGLVQQLTHNTPSQLTASQQPQIVQQLSQLIQQNPQMLLQGPLGQQLQNQPNRPITTPSNPQMVMQPLVTQTTPNQPSNVSQVQSGQPQILSQQNVVNTAQNQPALVANQVLTQQPAQIQQVQPQLIQQPQLSTFQPIPTQSGIITAQVQAPTVQLPQGMAQAQIVTPQGQVLQQALPSQLVQQLIQAQLNAQQQQAQQGQVVMQQVSNQPQQVIVQQQPQNQVLPQMLQGQVVMSLSGQSVPQATLTFSQTAPTQISLQVGSVIPQQVVMPQQQVIQGQVINQPQQQASFLPQPVVSAQLAPAAGNAPVRFVSQPPGSSQTSIQVPTCVQSLTSQNVAIMNQAAANSPGLPKSNSPYPVMQQQLHSSNPSITTPPPASPQSSRSSPGPMPSPGGSVKSVGSKRPPSRQSDSGENPTKKKRRSRSKDGQPKKGSSVPSSPSPATTPVPMTTFQYMCEWSSCRLAFEQIKQLQKHVIKTHYENLNGYCQWQGCDTLRRQRFSLITHVQDKHLNEAVLRAASVRRHQQIQAGGMATPSGSSAPPPVYPNDAAVQAIKRFAIKPPYQEFIEMKEGPVTKHIRLTSALILRNLAKYSSIGRSKLRKHEERLAYVALSPVESSAAIASCLAELNCKS